MDKRLAFMKRIVISMFLILILFLITLVFPVKFCVKTYPSNGNEFYVLRYDCLKNWWMLAGDSDGLYDWNTAPDQPVNIKGENFQETISGDLYLSDMPTYFIVWGDAEVQEQYDEKNDVLFKEYNINCYDWDILKEVHSRNEFRMRFSNDYLNIYDYKWFDDFRKLFWYYEEY